MFGRGVLRALLAHPSLWAEAVRAAWSMSSRRFPPRVDEAYAAWRVATAYGDPAAPVAGDDVVAYLRWRKELRRARRVRGG